jgi:hypothetical protein
MRFLKALFRDRSMEREALRRYAYIEFKGSEREAEYKRLLVEAGL